jgi:hypothetical protein
MPQQRKERQAAGVRGGPRAFRSREPSCGTSSPEAGQWAVGSGQWAAPPERAARAPCLGPRCTAGA